jgi:phage antirepressor YoqD-like protein
MDELIGNTEQDGVMSSVLLVQIINEYRKKEGNNVILQHTHFLQKIEKELDGDETKFRSIYLDKYNREQKCYNLPKDECMLMLMSESRIVRKGVLERLNDFVNGKHKLPTTFSQALKLASEQAEVIEQQQLLITEQAPKVLAYDKVIDNNTTYLLSTLADISGLGRGKVADKLREFGWLKSVQKSGTESTQYAKDMGYAKTIFDVKIVNSREMKTKQFVLFRKGIDRFLIKI